MFSHWKQSLCVLALAFGGAGEAAAELGLEWGVESFRWREFDAGERLLKETGRRYRLGANLRQAFGPDRRDSMLLRGALYFGRVDYDGQACTLSGLCVPFETNSNYFGLNGEATFSRRLGASARAEVFAGGGVDSWERDVKGRDDVAGAVEGWTAFYVFAGGGGHWQQAGARYHAQAGAKYPFYTHEVVDSFDVTLHPKGRASLFARLAADIVAHGRPQWGFGIYYDSYRFAMSDTERAGSILIWQPESKQETVGLYGVVYLN